MAAPEHEPLCMGERALHRLRVQLAPLDDLLLGAGSDQRDDPPETNNGVCQMGKMRCDIYGKWVQ